MEELIELSKREERKLNRKKRRDRFVSIHFKNSYVATLFLLSILFTVLLFYFLFIYFVRHNIYNNWSDDILQYYPIMCGFIRDIKEGNLSFYSLSNYLGASIYSDVYYIPFDPFTLIIFLLSFVMNTEVAMSITELLKMLSGVFALCLYLSIKGNKPNAVFLIGLMYFSCGGMTCFSVFPSFTSLMFYIPFSLVVSHLFLKGKWYIAPLYAMQVVFYNFYLAYMVFAFMCFSILVMAFVEGKKWYMALVDTALYVVAILLGLLMGMVMFLPSYKYIVECTTREVVEDSMLEIALYMLYDFIRVIGNLFIDTIHFIINIFSSTKNTKEYLLNLYNSFVNVRLVLNDVDSVHIIKDVSVPALFYKQEIYFRAMTTTYSPTYPSSFYGYLGSYASEHISFYITGTGLLFSSYIWFVKDRISNVYKVMMTFILIFLAFPLFSYIFSANFDTIYTRWFNLVSIPLLIIDAHIISLYGFKGLSVKKLFHSLFFVSYFAIFSSYYNMDMLQDVGEDNGWNESLIEFESHFFKYALLITILILLLLLGIYFISNIKNRVVFKKIFYPILYVTITVIFVVIAVSVLKEFNTVPISAWNSTDKSKYSYFDVTFAIYQELFVFAIIIFASLDIFSIAKLKTTFIYLTTSVEAVVAFSLAFGANVIYSDKETSYSKTHSLSDFIKENTEPNETYRVYLDSSISGIETTNASRLLSRPVNSFIFHSFIYKETDGIVYYLFDAASEPQADKEKINTYSYYLNILLGYKYVVADINSSYENYDTNIFDLVCKNDEYILLEFKDYEEFLSYDGYITKETYNSNKSLMGSSAEVSRAKGLIQNVIVDEKCLEDVWDYFSEESLFKYEESDVEELEIIKNKISFDSSNKEIVTIGEEKYYRYAFIGVDNITTRSYAINVFGFDSKKDILVENSHIFIEYENENKYYLDESNVRNMMGSTFHIPVTGQKSDNPIKYLYVYAGSSSDNITSVPEIYYCVEGIFANNNYMEKFEDDNDLIDGVYLEASIRFDISSIDYKEGVIYSFKVKKSSSSSSSSLSTSTIIVEYEDGSLKKTSGEISVELDNKPKYIYFIKTNDILELSSPPFLSVIQYNTSNVYSDDYIDKEVTFKNNKLSVSYHLVNDSDDYSILMIPWAYSDEWKIVSGECLGVVSVNGGFIGLIVSNSVRDNNIVLEFIPNGYKLGLKVSIIGILIYVGLLTSYIIYKGIRRKKYGKTQNNSSVL